MRPLRLELEGFASFRDRCEIDFTDTDLFVLTGPTGAGKSSVIDAMVFALYGSVPRYDKQNAIAPAICQGKNRALVQLDFLVAQTVYTVVRDVRRTTAGAVTKEVRLQQGETVLASGPEDVRIKVQDLLGLDFSQFTRCIALPQGAFAEFLRATPTDRQQLLVQLLDLGVYRSMSKRARAKATLSEHEADLINQQLAGDYSTANSENLRDAKASRKTLRSLDKEIKKTSPKIDALLERAKTSGIEAEEATGRAKEVTSVKAPARIEELAQALATATTTQNEAEASRVAAASAARLSQETLDNLPPESELRRAKADWKTKEALEESLGKLEGESTAAAAALAKASVALETRSKARSAAAELLETSRVLDAAADLANNLKTGQPCPVCLQDIEHLPTHSTAGDLEEAQQRAKQAALDEAKSKQEHSVAEREALQRHAVFAEKQSQFKELQTSLKGHKTPAELEDLALQLANAIEAKALNQRKLDQSFKAEAAARESRLELDSQADKAWQSFDQTCGRLTDFGPPQPKGRTDLARAWCALVTWAQRVAPGILEDAAAKASEAVTSADAASELLQSSLEGCLKAGIDTDAKKYREDVTRALANSERDVADLTRAIERAAQLKEKTKRLSKEAKVAGETAKLLGSQYFEKWLLQRAQQRLCEGASRILSTLSSEQYSIRMDSKSSQFEIIDHANADEARSAKTLSGGETFLASLALALALAEDVSQLAARGSARLEALFLDEGFGSLDSDTLDVVATAIESLGAQGRMIGVITHVKDLADRIPVRYHVRKDARTSTVEREVA